MGHDNISPKLLKMCAVPFTPPLTALLNVSLSSASISSDWKVHLITPIYKSGDHSLVTNYRSISLLCSTSNVLEWLIFINIIDFLRPSLDFFKTDPVCTNYFCSSPKLYNVLTTIISLILYSWIYKRQNELFFKPHNFRSTVIV